ncbi:MAG: reverse transcriptase family protein [Candidatus Nitrosopelagicus sp.]|nr:reverse transcriptase family protein [Candidatus Nitrosopelagicus sp.]
MEDPVNIQFLTKHDIVCFVETHSNYNDNLTLEGYDTVKKIRPKPKNAVKHYGGLAILVKKSIRKGIQFLTTENTELMWLKLKKDFFNLTCDIFLALVYINPENSHFEGKEEVGNLFEILESDIAKYNKMGECVIAGDFNARTGTLPDYCTHDFDLNQYMQLPFNYVQDAPMDRSNMDGHKPDSHGNQLLNLCKASNIRIVNGRAFGDPFGHFTCYKGEPSVIDYILCSDGIFGKVRYFNVSEPCIDSIHCKLTLQIKTGNYSVDHSEEKLITNYPLFVINDLNKDMLKKAFTFPKIQMLINELSETLENCDQSKIDMYTQNINNVFYEACRIARIFNKNTRNKKTQKTKNQKWFDKECKQAKCKLQSFCRKVRKSPFDRHLRNEYMHLKKSFRSLTKVKKRIYDETLFEKLETLQNVNPRKFWTIYNDLFNMQKQHKETPIPASQWKDHFTELFNTPLKISETRQNFVSEALLKTNIFNELDFRLTLKEMRQQIYSLKNNKAPGIDGLLNEMLKLMPETLQYKILTFFNAIFINSIYPLLWRTNFLTPIHKKGSNTETSNYRGIAVGSNLSKLFLSILNTRLTKFCNKMEIIPSNQLGYRKGCRTSDHVLTLKNIIDKYILRGKQLFSCFVDFKSAFDTVWRDGMLFKLTKFGVGGNMLRIIQNMYQTVDYRVKLIGGTTESIKSYVGVKQGCVLSPLLFNLYISDLPGIFDSTCMPITSNSDHINCLMYADDLIIMSETKDGLQICLNKLNDYCSQWNLTVNLTKTKVMIFNKTGKIFKQLKFYFGNSQIEVTSEYCYLGIVFVPCGSFSVAIKRLYDKSIKAFFQLKKFDSRSNITLTMKLFDVLVSPIIMYGSEVWGPIMYGKLLQTKSNKQNEQPFMHMCDYPFIEVLNMKLCKYLLSVGKHATNAAVRGELGRFPFFVKIFKLSVKYFKRLERLNSSSLVKSTHVANLKECSDRRFPLNSWNYNMKSILKHIHRTNIWQNHLNAIKGHSHTSELRMKKFMTHIESLYVQDWKKYLSNSSKLSSYSTFKKSFKLENYLLIKSVQTRKWFTKLRISNHNLPIETARYKKKNISRELRSCDSCNSMAMGNEKHMLLECDYYKKERDAFLNKVKEIFVLPDDLTSDICFQFLMSYNHGDTELAQLICKFVDDCFQKRREILFLHDLVRELEEQPETQTTRSGRVSRPPVRLNYCKF